MKPKPCLLLLAVVIAALGIYNYLPRPVTTSSPAKPDQTKSIVTRPERASSHYHSPLGEAPTQFPANHTTAAATPPNSKAVVSQPASLKSANGASGREKTPTIPAGHHLDTPPAPESEVMVPPAVRLSEKFRLPAGVMAQAMPVPVAGRTQSPQVRAASETVVTQFYQEISRQASLQAVGKNELAQDESAAMDDVATNDDLEPDTIVVEPDEATELVRKNADEYYRILFGDESYNRHTIQSAIEVTLPQTR